MKIKMTTQSGFYRLASSPLFIYLFRFRDRCRSGLSGTPGKRVLVKANRGFESLPVRSSCKDRVLQLPEAICGWVRAGFLGTNPSLSECE